MYMANMAWNSAMSIDRTNRHADRAGPETGEYRIPRIIYSDAYFSETVAYADLILPDTTYLERWDCISLLDRPIGSPDGPADAIRQPVIEPDRDVRPFQDVLLDLGAPAGPAGHDDADGSRAFQAVIADYIVHHERKPGIGPLAGWRGDDGPCTAAASPTRTSSQRYIEQWLLLVGRAGARAALLQARQPRLSRLRDADGLHRPCGARSSPALQRGAAEVPPGGAGHRPTQPPREHRARIETYFDPAAVLVSAARPRRRAPASRCTRSPSGRWRCTTPGARRTPGCGSSIPATASISAVRAPARWGSRDGDWVWIISRHGRVKAQIRLMAGVNPDTCWTWNAIGKRAGAWNLTPGGARGDEGLPAQPPDRRAAARRRAGYRYANADPVTGQAAWYDLRVRLEKAREAEAGVSVPQLPALTPPRGLPERADGAALRQQFRQPARRP